MQMIPSAKLVVIDGLDECSDGQTQVAILEAISCSFPKHNLPIIFLVVTGSRPEVDLVASFNGKQPLKSIHRRLALDDTYRPDDDIRLFLSDKFKQIQCTHRLRSTIPNPWPTEKVLQALVEKSSGQFIFAATVVRFVESNRHRPVARLDVFLKISPPGNMNPFTELDALYKQILSSVDDIQLTLRVLSLYAVAPNLARRLHKSLSISSSVEHFLLLEEGDIDLALTDLSSIVSYDEPSGEVEILHASFVDFLSDSHLYCQPPELPNLSLKLYNTLQNHLASTVNKSNESCTHDYQLAQSQKTVLGCVDLKLSHSTVSLINLFQCLV
jgi:hypothetical protein